MFQNQPACLNHPAAEPYNDGSIGNAQGTNVINEGMEKENGQEKEGKEDNGPDVTFKLDELGPSVAQDAQEQSSKRGEVALSSNETKRGEDPPIVAQDAREPASKRDEDAPTIAHDAREPASKRGEDVPTAECTAVKLLGNDTIKEESIELSKSNAFDVMILEKSSELDRALCKIEGLTEIDRDTALSKLPDHPGQMMVFFSLSPDRRLVWVKRFLKHH
ncbi:hypothetical protein SLEP1_g57541 [Rubroshorea leprosula]|uniref:Uncharacterized protein n=1 Tax=Rubroshorea leprosula TaxID=152421 RepID=A0AAV5MLK4_9ROSI|nr:hypothetical protein SLEP1_g57541 [Rubroshorea leprosula]